MKIKSSDAPRGKRLTKRDHPAWLTFVHVHDDNEGMGPGCEDDFDAFVGDSSSGQYEVFIVEDGKIIGQIAWIAPENMTPYAKQDFKKAQKLVDKYNEDTPLCEGE